MKQPTDINDSKFVDHLYIDWHVAKQPTKTNMPL